MTKQAIIEKTVKTISQLPQEKAEEIADFADFIAKRYEEEILAKGMEQITFENQSFSFLNDDEDLYTEQDLKQVYHHDKR
ncbi:MAG: hypothetical protein EOP42_33595 [Sphingobacteriaceae bacterium]|nr:MAG: hypothetical protein EOP42_33595 [Sphingobacteriaceae bacterium]